MSTRFRSLIITGLVATFLSLTAHAKPFSKLIAFSGSLTDTGNAAAMSGDLPPPFYNNRNADGPVAIDILAQGFGLSSDPSLHLVGQAAGTNYAALHASAAGDLPIDLPAQIDAYFSANGPISDPDALYFIFIGANDIVSAGLEQDEYISHQILKNAINEIETAFRRLHESGARIFYAPNNVDIGIAPISIQYGVTERMTKKTIKFNQMLELKTRRLERELGISIYRFDFFRFANDLLKVSDKINLTNTTDSCLDVWDQGLCDLNSYAFINELLPTAKIHALFGNALVSSLIEQMAFEQPHPKCIGNLRSACRHNGYAEIVIPKKQ